MAPEPDTTGSSSTSSLLRRLKSKTSSLAGFRTPRRRSPHDFQIHLSDPHRVYSPSSIVAGHVRLTTDRPLAITHLTVALVGRVTLSSDNPSSLVLCRDEVVLTGEGRLEPCVYKFGFELEFARRPGIGSLPSSIEFEKGLIEYFIIAQLTRPTATHPTTTLPTRIELMDTIDISRQPLPKPRIISLSPLTRSSKSACSSPSPPPSPSGLSTKSKPPITATISLLSAGAIRGGQIPIKISISHTKAFRSMAGIVIALFRQTSFPDPLPPASGNLKPEKHITSTILPVYRKDLSQTVQPLIIDGQTLTADVSCSIKVPDDVFPSIGGIAAPAGSKPLPVEFRYFVEVVLDLRGKLARLGGAGKDGMAMEGRRRREKGVVCVRFEVVVGSVDSMRRKVRRVVEGILPEEVALPDSESSQGGEGEMQQQQQQQPAWPQQQQQRQQPISPYPPPPPPPLPPLEEHQQHNPFPYPPLAPLEEGPANEKERLRLAEEALLPSRPPGFGGAGPSQPLLRPSSPAPAYQASSSPSRPPQNMAVDQGEDKQEAERRRLVALESEPPGYDR